MNPPVAARGHAPALREPGTHTHTDLRVRYYDRMKVQRVYPLTVEVTAGPNRPGVGLALDPVVVRPVIPGAQVVPAEQRLDVSRPGERAAFHVTPLARGRYPNPRVEILQHGRTVQAIALRMKGVTQRLTWLLLALTLLLPALVFHYTRTAKLRGRVPYQARRPDLGPAARRQADEEKKDANDKDKPKDADEKKDTKDGGREPGAALLDLGRLLVRADDPEKKPEPKDAPGKDAKKNDEPAARDKDKETPKKADEPAAREKEAPKAADQPGAREPETPKPEDRGQRPGGRRPGGPRLGGGGPPGAPGGPPRLDPAQVGGGIGKNGGLQIAPDQTVGGSSGEVLEYTLNEEAHSVLGKENAATEFLTERVVPPVAWGLGQAYTLACNMEGTYFWLALILLGLTLISAYLHRARRASRRLRIELTAAPSSPHAQETLPLGPGDARPLNIEPA
jgi:hypothetical protein